VPDEIPQKKRSGLVAEQMAVQHQRKPGQGMPVTFVVKPERPLEILPAQAVSDVLIALDIKVIVEIKKLMLMKTPVGKNNASRNCRHQNGIHQKRR